MNNRPLLLDLFCGAGGASVGYYRAGFDVIGIDLHPMPSYPYDFIQANALEFLDDLIKSGPVDAVTAFHASPPCQLFTPLAALPNASNNAENLIEPTRKRLRKLGKPYVLENVVQAPLISPVMLCGQSFGLKLYRHRNFETDWLLPAMPHEKHRELCMKAGYLPTAERPYMSIHGRNGYNSKAWVSKAAEYMGMPWASDDLNGVCEAIPPAYTEYIGKHLMTAMKSEAGLTCPAHRKGHDPE